MADCIILPELRLDSGIVLREVPVVYDSWGELNQDADNAIIVCHALTGNTRADVWWGPLIGPGRPIDTDRFFVVCLNVLGSPYGSASPLTTNPETGAPYGVDFPQTTIRDTVRAHHRALQQIGVRQAAFAIGGSMGGMQALEWAFTGDFVRGVVPIAVGGRHSAWCIGWSESQRQAIYADSRWNGGRYEEQPSAGLATARMIAMISYRSRASFEQRFGRTEQPASDELFAVESYLRYQGVKLVERFDANCYVHLTRQMDTHDVARDRGEYDAVLRSVAQHALIIGIDSDILYPLCEQEELAERIPDAELQVISSAHGHDAFLIELEDMDRVIRSWMNRYHETGTPQKAVAESAR